MRILKWQHQDNAEDPRNMLALLGSSVCKPFHRHPLFGLRRVCTCFIPQAGQRAPGDVPGEVHGDQEFYRMSRHYKSLKSWTVIFVGMESENSTVKGTSIRCISRDPQTHTFVQAFCNKLGANESQRVTHASPLVQW